MMTGKINFKKMSMQPTPFIPAAQLLHCLAAAALHPTHVAAIVIAPVRQDRAIAMRRQAKKWAKLE
jgi:hypothetical protein